MGGVRVAGRLGMSIGRSLIRDGVGLGGGRWRRGRGMGRSIGRVLEMVCHRLEAEEAGIKRCILVMSEAFGRRYDVGRRESWDMRAALPRGFGLCLGVYVSQAT